MAPKPGEVYYSSLIHCFIIIRRSKKWPCSYVYCTLVGFSEKFFPTETYDRGFKESYKCIGECLSEIVIEHVKLTYPKEFKRRKRKSY